MLGEILQELCTESGPDETLQIAYGGADFARTAPTDVALEGEGQQVRERVRKNGRCLGRVTCESNLGD